ncbi:MAG TPA: RNA polymerase sigma factor [Polyangia bacterium]|nr:RNA polymerase sigma factor [Polyangia bacterium]
MAEVHGPVLFKWALAQTGKPCDAWDLVQDTFERALRSAPGDVNESELRSWLFTVLRNRFRDQRRAARVRRVADINLDALPIAEPAEQPAWARVDMETITDCLPSLPPRVREAFRLHLAGHRAPAIARLLGIKTSTVAIRIFRARRRLHQLLGATTSANDNRGD